MTYKEFYNKLHPFFTDRQIKNLANYGIEATKNIKCYNAYEYVCLLFYEYMADEPDDCRREIEQIAGGTFTEESRVMLDRQMDIEW